MPYGEIEEERDARDVRRRMQELTGCGDAADCDLRLDREVSMSETTQEERDQWRKSLAEMVRRLTHDADRLARLEDGIRALADEYRGAAEEMDELGDYETAELWGETEQRLRALLND